MKTRFFSKEIVLYSALTIALVWFLFSYIDLKPHVDYNVFFSKDDPTYKADVEISKIFRRDDTQILISISGDIRHEQYQKKIKQFGDYLLNFKEIKDIKSIFSGPRSVDDALESPLWSRLLISDNGRSSNILATLDPGLTYNDLTDLISRTESLKSVFESDDFIIKISGSPYITELIRRHLNQDLRTFTTMAIIIFGVIIFLILHSWQIFLGIIITCFNAAALTLICTSVLKIKVGILTANLTTIIFVITLSHIVFLTFNWKHLYHIKDSKQAAREAVRMTIPASFWAMATTLLGFLSLLFVRAQPLRELGTSGAIGTFIGFALAYTVYPVFLSLKAPSQDARDLKVKNFYDSLFLFVDQRKWFVIIGIMAIAAFTIPDLKSLNLDPSLISFFPKESEITKGLQYVDKHGGSNPLVMVVKSQTGDSLDTKVNMRRLNDLQLALEEHPQVGNLISVPLLVSEARRSSYLSFLFSNDAILKQMATPKYGGVAKSFISQDHRMALLLLRMKEDGRVKHRLEVIEELEKIIENNEMAPYLTGGIYALQGNLSKHVAESLIYGLGRLFLIFVVIALIVSYSLRISLALSFSIGLIPLCILGIFGAFKLPLDIIAAPAANIAISMGIDAMLHMIHAFNRHVKEFRSSAEAWQMVKQRMWEPVMTSMLIVSSGFAIFFFSSFPPTQRFGGSIVFGTVIAALSAIFIFPLLSQVGEKFRLDLFPEAPKKPTSRLDHFKDADLN